MSVVPIGNGRLVTIARDGSAQDENDERLREWTGVLALRQPVMCVSCELAMATLIYDFGTERPVPVCDRCAPTPIGAPRMQIAPTGGAS